MKPRIALVHPFSQFDTVPSLCNTVELLAQAGVHVDVYCHTDQNFPPPTFSLDSVRVFALQYNPRHSLARRLNPASWLFAVQAWRRHRQNPYRCVIGADPEGLATARLFVQLARIPLIYYSLELLLSSEVDRGTRRLKQHELCLSRKAAFIIIQDIERAKILAKDNGLSLERFVLVPNAPIGPARRKRNNYWQERFHLPPETHIVLHAGSLESWTGIDQIVASTATWPDHWVLVVHTRYVTNSSEALKRLADLSPPGRVFFSTEPVNRHEYAALVDGADVGIAFYVCLDGSRYTQRNLQVLGLSSGKISAYLRAGLPVITNHNGLIGGLVQREQCGIVVQSSDEISRAIQVIAKEYSMYSRQACLTFDNHLDFATHFGPVLDRMRHLIE